MARATSMVFALVIMLCAADGHAQRVTSVWTAVSEVHDIVTLGERTLLATSGGLVVRRNGQHVQTLTSRDGLDGSRLRSVSVTEDGVWVGGVEGLALLARRDLRVLRRIPIRRVRRVIRSGDHIYAASYGAGLFRVPDEGAPVAIDLGRSHARRRLTDVVSVGSELYVASASAGILVVNLDEPTPRVRRRITARRGLADDIVFDLERVGARVYAATFNGLSVINARGRVLRDHADTARAALLPSRDLRGVLHANGRIYLASYGGGLIDLHGEGRIGSVARNALTVANTSGGLVVGHEDGAHRLRDGELSSLTEGGLPSADLTALAFAFGKLFIGTFDHGLATMSRGVIEEHGRAHTRFGVDRRINDLAVTRDAFGREHLYIATDRGLFVHDGRSFTPIEDDAAPRGVHVTSLHVAGDGALWVTSSRMLSRLRNGTWRAFGGDERFPVMQLHAVTTDDEGAVWVGSLHGLFRLDEESGSYDRFTVSSGDLPVDWVTALTTLDGEVVAGTYHGGLSWFGDEVHVEREGGRGVPSGWVNPHAMRRIGDRLFVGTLERGLMVGRRGQWSTLSLRNGLPSDDVTDVLADGAGNAWVATRGGLAKITLDG